MVQIYLLNIRVWDIEVCICSDDLYIAVIWGHRLAWCELTAVSTL